MLVALTFSFVVHAQDSTHVKPVKDSLEADEAKVKFIFSFDGRRSFVLDRPVKFSGLRIGLEINQVHDIGLGFYGTQNPVRQRLPDQPLDVEAEFSYTTLFYQFALYHTPKWEFGIPLHLGGGTANVRLLWRETGDVVLDEAGNPLELRDLPFAITETGLSGQYKIVPWLGVGTDVGYRKVISSDSNAKRVFNAPYFSFKVKVFFGQLYKSIKRGRKKRKAKRNHESAG